MDPAESARSVLLLRLKRGQVLLLYQATKRHDHLPKGSRSLGEALHRERAANSGRRNMCLEARRGR